ncbi:hypothetical protein F4777DRAFT_548908 [Nemania sp. FL0916]|nr:hypothetical protein F4777DRAFT_548908 [Nemania sp. FL0916]
MGRTEFDREHALSPRNVEDNVMASIQLRDLDSKTPLRQHDNAWIRLPTQFAVGIVEHVEHVPQRITIIGEAFFHIIGRLLANIANLVMELLIRFATVTNGHILFISLILAFGIWLVVSLSRGNIKPGLIIGVSILVVAWAIYLGIVRRYRQR